MSFSPQEFIGEKAAETGLTLLDFDPGPLDWSPQTHEDLLLIQWPRDGLVYVNPPFSKTKKWVVKCDDQHKKGSDVMSGTFGVIDNFKRASCVKL